MTLASAGPTLFEAYAKDLADKFSGLKEWTPLEVLIVVLLLGIVLILISHIVACVMDSRRARRFEEQQVS